ncbi:uncharacterized protein [Solanum lycopersicum]|uniref:uncharacterized protein n=1 Tax=Solanum lycopersicum TaxID=4081 RepID=UPI000532E8E2
MDQVNREVGPRVSQRTNTMSLRLRDFTRMSPPMFFELRSDVDLEDFLYEVCKILYAMGVTLIEKAKLADYQFKYVAQTWYVQWKKYRALRVGLVTRENFKRALIDRFLLREMREAKFEEFISHRQGGMSVLENSLKFTKLSKYAPSFVSNPRDEMSGILAGVSNNFVEECGSIMLHDNMSISLHMVHAQQVQETRLSRKNIESKRVKSYEGGAFKGRPDNQVKPRIKKRY